MPKIKCLLVDDHTLFRQAVHHVCWKAKAILKSWAKLPTAEKPWKKHASCGRTSVLMDIGMPGSRHSNPRGR